MKAKKARKRLVEVDELLAEVIEGYTVDGNGVHDLLDSARKAVGNAITGLEKPAAKKIAVSATTSAQRRQPAERRKRLPLEAKKRAIAKSTDLEAVSGRPLHQTA